jgi:hypothetical protein
MRNTLFIYVSQCIYLKVCDETEKNRFILIPPEPPLSGLGTTVYFLKVAKEATHTACFKGVIAKSKELKQ